MNSETNSPHQQSARIGGPTSVPPPPQLLPSTAASGTPVPTSSVAIMGTVTITETEELQPDPEQQVLRLTLAARPTVRWDESVLNNEGLGRKSSKRCCIFHKQRSFGESSTDSSDNDSDRSGSSTASGSAGDGDDDKKMKPKGSHKNRKIARPKSKGSNVPDFQRFHA